MKNYGYLTSEEYRAIRKTLGFSQQEVADFHGLSVDHTIKQWESGKSTTSYPACEKITHLLDLINDHIEEVIETWENDKQDVFLITYDEQDYKKQYNLSCSVYNAMIYRIYTELKRIGANAYIVKFNKSSYAYFMADNGLTDSPENRTKWAKWYRLNYFNVLPAEKEEKRVITHSLEEMYFYLTDHPKLSPRYMEIVKLRMDGNNLTQVAQLLGVSRQRINDLWHKLDDMID